jgi:hypothetical protein
MREVVQFHCRYLVRTELQTTLLCVDVRNSGEAIVFYSNDDLMDAPCKREPGVHSVILTIPQYLLTPGDYTVSFAFWEPGRQAEHLPQERLSFFRSEPPNRLSAHGIAWPGAIYMPGTWTYLGGKGKD